MSAVRPDFDVGIIGGGPAGSATAAYLAKAGVSCVVLEAETFPRAHVGESLVPSSTRVFDELGFLKTMEEAGFPKKFGAVWTSSGSRARYKLDWQGLELGDHAEIKFDEREQSGVKQPYTYHVDRGKFDLLLLRHAGRFGASVKEGTRVTGVDFSSEFPTLTCKTVSAEEAISVRLVVDASGRRTLLGNQLRLKIKDPVFDQFAMHAWFENYDRATASRREFSDYIFVHFLPISNSWVWQIPVSDTVTSVGVVTQRKNIPTDREKREGFFWEAVGTRPELIQGLRKATQIRPLKDEGDYSYSMSQITGDRFILVGDAGRFVDAIFSTGVSIALNSARFASRDIIEAMRTGNFRQESFRKFEATVRRGTRNWHEFISIYYRLNVLFTYFVQKKEYRLEVLKLLQGDVYDEEEPEVLKKMRAMVREVEEDQNHPWHKLLGDLTANAFRPGP